MVQGDRHRDRHQARRKSVINAPKLKPVTSVLIPEAPAAPESLPLVIHLFGGAEVRRGDAALPQPRTRKGYSLLALLALRAPQPVDRSWLAGTLWPDAAEAAALTNLRNCLHDLRRLLGQDAARLAGPAPRSLAF